MTITEYIRGLNTQLAAGNATEHSYRPDLKGLLETLIPGAVITNEPSRIKCGAPDFIITVGDIPLGYVEAKDLGAELGQKSNFEQFDRYRKALPNIIFTNYLDFWYYRNNQLVSKVSLGEVDGDKVKQNSEDPKELLSVIHDFSSFTGQTISSPVRLAEMMAIKAQLLASVIERALSQDEESEENSILQEQLEAFKTILIHDLTEKQFADIYAQTIAYGMFAARVHDPTPSTFTAKEASELIPKTNPFLRKLFQYNAGYDIDTRISWIVDALANLFRATDITAIVKNFGNRTHQKDPIIHFYETFLSEYDAETRADRGVWYTPPAVIDFMVSSVDHIIKHDFNMAGGLMDNTKIKVKVDAPKRSSRVKDTLQKVEVEIHKLQVLDPAVGTGGFLAGIINYLNTKFEGQEGAWSSFVQDHLIPRLNGFELLMASYAVAHLKLDLLLAQTGYKPTKDQRKDQRFRIFLTNSLEEYHPQTGTIFTSLLSDEANYANQIKKDRPVMLVIGNPPYKGISQNMGDWAKGLIKRYKYINGVHFGERKHWLNDDYVKFIGLGQLLIEKSGEGILTYINNHRFLDNRTMRGMRLSLMETFEKIYIIDLHGSADEIPPSGLSDENIFPITKGVSINVFVKRGKSKKGKLAQIYHFDIWGSRKYKLDYLSKNELLSIPFKRLEPVQPYYFFVPKTFEFKTEYDDGFKLDELMFENVSGVVTARDPIAVDFTFDELKRKIVEFASPRYTEEELRLRYYKNKKQSKYPPGDTRGWKLQKARLQVQKQQVEEYIIGYSYRPFDKRFIYYHESIVDWGREKIMRNFLEYENVALVVCKQTAIDRWEHVGITDTVADDCLVSNRSKERGYVFPLFINRTNPKQPTLIPEAKFEPNFNQEILNEIQHKLSLVLTDGEVDREKNFAPIDLFDYIYSILYSPTFREKFQVHMKTDFPRVPYPTKKKTFWSLVDLGKELRQLHLLQVPALPKYITSYPVSGDNTVERWEYEIKDEVTEMGRVWINEQQYFDNVPKTVWDFYYGAYRPAEKWLKDRKQRTLSFDEIFHYQKIIVALSQTQRLMDEIDNVLSDKQV